MAITETLTEQLKIQQSQDALFQDFLKFIRQHNLFAKSDSVIVAVSGGLDSSVLAYLMAKASKVLGINIAIAHVDHQTRGGTSKHEGEWVRAMAAKLGVKVHNLTIPEALEMNQNEYRNHRRKLLLDLGKILGASKIATAHHADDNAETFLMRAISGTGINGLRGMSPQNGSWIKPLLKFSRRELSEYARANRIAWVEDASNARSQYLRNRIRNEFFPLLEEIRQSSVSNLSQVAQRLWEEEEELSGWLDGQMSELSPQILPFGWLEKWPVTLQRRIFRTWLERNKLEPNPELIENLLAGREVIHTQGVILKHSDTWVFYPENDFGSKWSQFIDLELNRRSFLGASLAWSFLPKAQEKFKVYDFSVYLCQRSPGPKEDLSMCLNWESLPKSLVVRPLRREDPEEAHAMLRQFRMPRAFARVWPVISSREHPHQVYAVVGVGIIEAYRYSHRGPCVFLETFFEEALSSN